MSPWEMLQTSGLLGLFVLLAGGYGILYGLGHLHGRRDLVGAGFMCYVLQCLVAASVIAFTPLLVWWKAFIALSCALYCFIPPVTWRYLTLLHRLEERES